MKNQLYRLNILLLFLLTFITVRSQNVTMPDFQIQQGGTSEVNLSVTDIKGSLLSYQGFQLDLVLPDGLTLKEVNLPENLIAAGFTFTKKEFESSNIYRILAYSDKHIESQEFLTLEISAASSLEAGDKTIKLQDIVFSTPAGDDIFMPESESVVTVTIPVTSVTLNKTSLRLPEGSRYELEATVYPDNATYKTVTWDTSDPGVATVAGGLVKAVGKGTATITATCGEISAECEVTVYDSSDIIVKPGDNTTQGNENNTPANNTTSGGSLSGTDLTIRVNQTGRISLAWPESITQAPMLEWSLEEGGDAYADLQTLSDMEASFTGVAMGKTTYYVRIQGEADPIVVGQITVIAEFPLTSLSLSPSALSIAQNADATEVKANYQPGNASAPSLTWTNLADGVASILASGDFSVAVTPKTKGQTIITAKANDGSELTAQCVVDVTSPVDENFEFDFDDAAMNSIEGIDILIGSTYQLKPKAREGYDLPSGITWTSSDPQTVSVTNDGTVHGLKLGSANITASASFNGNTVSATCKVNVLPILASTITLSTENLKLFVGQSATLGYTLYPENVTDPSVVWDSGDPSTATVEDGKVKGVKAGKTTITVKCGNAQAVCSVTVSGNDQVQILPGEGTEEGDEGNSPAENTDQHGSLIGNDLTLRVGQTAAVKVKLPNDLSTNPELNWSLAEGGADIVTMSIDQNTLGASFTGLKMGVTGYTLTLKGNSEEIAGGTITVIAERPITSLELEPARVSMAKNAYPVQLTPKYTPANATASELIWTSSRQDVATVSTTGLVTPLSQGETVITAKTIDGSELSAFSNITVTKPVDNEFSFDFGDAAMGGVNGISIYLGDTYQLHPKAQEGYELPSGITWTSSDPQTVSVTNNGTVKGLKLGSAEITASATFNGKQLIATCTVTVIAVQATEIQLNTKAATIYIGESVTIEATVKPVNTTYPTIIWSSDNTGVATVDANGNVTGISAGTATVTASCGNVKATCRITVNPVQSERVTVNPESVILLVGASVTVSATVMPQNTTDKTVAWTSANPAVATVSSSGVITAIAPGTTVVTAKNGNNTGSCRVTVNPVPSTAVTLNVEDITLNVGTTSTLTATVSPSNTTDKSLVWASDKPEVATVSSTGVVTAIAPGTATITVSNGDASATCKVTVLANKVTSITLNVEDQTIYVAATTQLTATVSPNEATDKTVTWTSNNTAIAIVDANGLVTGVSAGTAIITATCGDVSANCIITVIAREIAPIKVTTSDLKVSTMDGKQVLMWVSTEGGNPDGWYFSWIYNSEEVSTEKNLEIMAQNSNDIPVTESYSVNVRNVNDGELAYNETFTFSIEIWPGVELPFGDDAEDEDQIGNNDGTNKDENGWWERNGIHVETLKVREGSSVGMYTEAPQGGYNNEWYFNWTINGKLIGDEQEISYTAEMAAGTGMEISSQTPKAAMTNYGPEGDVWYQSSAYGPTIDVYRRPETPLQMLRKGDGNSHIFIVMMPISDAMLAELQYMFVYGYSDADGNDHIIEITDLRYCRAAAEVYNDPSNNFWAYSLWSYADGSVVSSGLRYLDGASDENFDASNFTGDYDFLTRNEGESRSSIYTLDGHYRGSDETRLVPGIYIKHTIKDGVSTAKKIIVH